MRFNTSPLHANLVDETVAVHVAGECRAIKKRRQIRGHESADFGLIGGHSSSPHCAAKTCPVEPGVKALARDARCSGDNGAFFDRHLPSLQPVLDMLSQHLPVSSRRQLGGAPFELVYGNLYAGSVVHDLFSSQECLQDSTQTLLRTSNAKSFAMKKLKSQPRSIGLQVKEFMEAKNLTPALMAELVNQHGGNIDGGQVSRQNIDQLIAGDVGTPRKYFVSLAKAMETTTDVLHEGRYRYGEAPIDPAAPTMTPAEEVAQALGVLKRATPKSDNIARLSLELLFAVMSREEKKMPDRSQSLEPGQSTDAKSIVSTHNGRTPPTNEGWSQTATSHSNMQSERVRATIEQSNSVPRKKRLHKP